MPSKKEMLWKNKLYFGKEENGQNGLIVHAYRFLDMPNPMAQVLRLYIHGSELWAICMH